MLRLNPIKKKVQKLILQNLAFIVFLFEIELDHSPILPK